MIITVAPFPAVEHIYQVDSFDPETEVSAKNVKVNILSKGIHSAEMIKILQDEPVLLSIMGGFAGKYIKNHLDKRKIKTDSVWSDVETPHSAKICVERDNTYFLVKRNSYTLLEKEIIKLDQKLRTHYKNVSTMVLAGYIPEGIDNELYKNWIKEAKVHNIKTILSTGQSHILDLALQEVPYALMFTSEQLKQLQVDTSSYENIIEAMEEHLDKGVHYIGIYLKNRGMLMLSKSKKCWADAPSGTYSASDVSASGAFLGAFAIGVNRKYEHEKFAKQCLAAALAVAKEDSKCTKKEIDLLAKKIKIRE